MAMGMGFTFWAYSQIEDASNLRRSSRDLITTADELMSAIKDVETSQRGYALTGDESYLQPYVAVRQSVTTHLTRLRQLSSGTPAQRHLDAMAPLLAAKLVEIDETIALRRNHDLAAAMSRINSGEGNQLQHNAQFDASMRRLFAIIVGIGVLAVLAIAVFCLSELPCQPSSGSKTWFWPKPSTCCRCKRSPTRPFAGNQPRLQGQ
jgi:hypothetical protein